MDDPAAARIGSDRDNSNRTNFHAGTRAEAFAKLDVDALLAPVASAPEF